MKYLESQKQIRNEQRQAAKKALRVKLKNKRNTRVGQAPNPGFIWIRVATLIQARASQRAFIQNHLAKVRLAKSLGMGRQDPIT